MLEDANRIVSQLSLFLWGVPLVSLLVGAGVYYSFRLRFIQIREFFHGIKVMLGFFENKRHKGQISHFQALCTALSATIGTGNIAGVATAIALGGPGAVFWMWITGLFGMALKYASCALAVKYRVINKDGTVAGGPMYYLEKGLGMKGLAVVFAFCTAVTATFIGNMVQSNSVADVLFSSLGVPRLLTGVLIAFFVWLVIVGGIKRIAKVSQAMVPFMTVAYLSAGLVIIFINIEKILPALHMIFKSAFSPASAAGGFTGSSVLYAMRMGVARGVFSNEAGLGSAPIAHAAARENIPSREGLVAMIGPFIDTLVVCTMTALIIIVSGAWTQGLNGATLTRKAFDAATGGIGGWVVVFGLIFFALSTTISWSYYGDRACYYIFGERALAPYRWVYSLLIPFGAIFHLELIWNLADIANAMMAVPNIIAIFGLAGVVVKLTRDYERNLRISRRLHLRRT